jgi:hypothetical protein
MRRNDATSGYNHPSDVRRRSIYLVPKHFKVKPGFSEFSLSSKIFLLAAAVLLHRGLSSTNDHNGVAIHVSSTTVVDKKHYTNGMPNMLGLKTEDSMMRSMLQCVAGLLGTHVVTIAWEELFALRPIACFSRRGNKDKVVLDFLFLSGQTVVLWLLFAVWHSCMKVLKSSRRNGARMLVCVDRGRGGGKFD